MPRESVIVARVKPVAIWVATIFASGMAADCGSVTVPDRVAEATCALAVEARRRMSEKASKKCERSLAGQGASTVAARSRAAIVRKRIFLKARDVMRFRIGGGCRLRANRSAGGRRAHRSG